MITVVKCSSFIFPAAALRLGYVIVNNVCHVSLHSTA